VVIGCFEVGLVVVDLLVIVPCLCLFHLDRIASTSLFRASFYVPPPSLPLLLPCSPPLPLSYTSPFCIQLFPYLLITYFFSFTYSFVTFFPIFLHLFSNWQNKNSKGHLFPIYKGALLGATNSHWLTCSPSSSPLFLMSHAPFPAWLTVLPCNCHNLGMTTEGVLDRWKDLLTTYTQHSELQVITALLLISTLYKSEQHLLSLFQPAVSSSAVPWKQLLTLNILQIPVLRFYLQSLPCRIQLSTDNWQLATLNCQAGGHFTPTS
jgi:hypothetical protein